VDFLAPSAIPTISLPKEAAAVEEQFDANSVRVSGTVAKINPFTDHVLAHVDSRPDGEEDGIVRVTVAFPTAANMTLMPSEPLSASGYLREIPYTETLRSFLRRADRADILTTYEEQLAQVAGISVQRSLTAVIPVDEDAEIPVNQVRVSGIISRVWQYSRHTFVRLAVYDSHCDAEPTSPALLPHRIAHYVTVQFPDSQVDGRPVTIGSRRKNFKPGMLKPRLRILVSGHLANRVYSETLSAWLQRAKLKRVFSELPDFDMDVLKDIRVRYGQIIIVADTLVQFTT
jgi:hypothetical protein